MCFFIFASHFLFCSPFFYDCALVLFPVRGLSDDKVAAADKHWCCVYRLATAYAITKSILPVRLVFSVWATPWFARISVVPVTNVFKRMFGRKPKTAVATISTSKVVHAPAQLPAAGTGATGGGVVSKMGRGP